MSELTALSHQLKRLGVVIAGPTGIGKTDVAIHLKDLLQPACLISCDSVQVYRDLSIGANKDYRHEHHLVDVVDWRQPLFTSADYAEACWSVLRELDDGTTPIMVGGTGMYVEWVTRGRPGAPEVPKEMLENIKEELRKVASWEEKLTLLQSVDPVTSSRLSPNDEYRLIRALAVYRHSGKPLSFFPRHLPPPQLLSWRIFYLYPADRLSLYRRIDARCEQMIQAGLLQEVWSLRKQGLSTEMQAGRAIGYRQCLEFFDELDDTDHFKEKFILFLRRLQAETRQYSRRQETWYRNQPDVSWVEVRTGEDPKSIAEKIFSAITQNQSIIDSLPRKFDFGAHKEYRSLDCSLDLESIHEIIRQLK